MSAGRDAVTGAFGFTGRALAMRLVDGGRDVVTLTRRRDPSDPLAGRVTSVALDFTQPDRLVAALQGVETLYNTYWLRFPRGRMDFDRAIEQTAVLFAAAQDAGVARLVHVSVVRAAPDGPTPYVRAKGGLEGIVAASGIPWSIVRPTLTYGEGDILINNLAWTLRRLPIFGIAGRGRYPIQPVHVDDVARVCVEAAAGQAGTTVDAAGPETLAYREMVEVVRTAVGSGARVVSLPGRLVLVSASVLGLLVRDVVLTRNELIELTGGLLTSAAPPLGRVSFPTWVASHADELGRRWASELARNYRLPPVGSLAA